MEINKTSEGKLLSLFEKALEDPNLELEFLLQADSKRTIDEKTFERLVKELRKYKNLKMTRSEVLDISCKGFRFSIKGNEAIRKYCRTEKITPDIEPFVTILKKTREKDAGNIGDITKEYQFKCNLKSEKVFNMKDAGIKSLIKDWSSLEKTFRYKKRYSFRDDEEMFQYDLSVVKSSSTKKIKGVIRQVPKSSVRDNQHKFIVMPREVTNFDAWFDNLNSNQLVSLEGRTREVPIPKKSIKASRVFENPMNFEVELEFIGNNTGRKSSKPIAKDAVIMGIKYIGTFLKIRNNERFLMSESRKSKCYTTYRRLLESLRINRLQFIGPQPVTLDRENVVELDIAEYTKSASIRKNYTVTDKADGERNLLVIDEQGYAFYVNRKLSIKSAGFMLPKFPNTIIDGEYITTTKQGNSVAEYHAFDIYMLNYKDLRSLPLVNRTMREDSRLNELKKIQSDIDDQFGVKPVDNKSSIYPSFFTKKFRMGDKLNSKKVSVLENKINELKELLKKTSTNELKEQIKAEIAEIKADTKIFNECKKIYNEERRDYHIDGLIFTPMYLSVGQDEEGPLTQPSSGRWKNAFKWKPIDENSIDFRVESVINSEGNEKIIVDADGDECKVFNLLVGYNPKTHTKYNSLLVLNEQRMFPDDYTSQPFQPTHPYVEKAHEMTVKLDVTKRPRCEDKSLIQSDSLVECKWVIPEGAPSSMGSWVPMRLRDNRNPNDFNTAINVWKTIHYPVTFDMIRGGSGLNTLEREVYYRNVSKDDKKKNLGMKAMRDFHSFVKQELFRTYTSAGNSLLDISVGKGGDINRWQQAKLGLCVGIDINLDNLDNPEDGAANRILNVSDKSNIASNTLLICADSSKSYVNGDAGHDNLQKTYLDIVFGRTDNVGLNNTKLLKFKNLGNSEVEGFDAVSCQFSLHYFFENRQKLETMLSNVSSSLKENGYFFGTCFDGELVNDFLNEHDGSFISKEGNDSDINYKLTRNYSPLQILPNTEASLGKSVEVYFGSIGSTVNEYLVSFRYLEEVAKKYNLSLVKVADFTEEIEQVAKASIKFGKADELVKHKDLLQYSSMNKKFIFQKTA